MNNNIKIYCEQNNIDYDNNRFELVLNEVSIKNLPEEQPEKQPEKQLEKQEKEKEVI
jgi:hypothetical protein